MFLSSLILPDVRHKDKSLAHPTWEGALEIKNTRGDNSISLVASFSLHKITQVFSSYFQVYDAQAFILGHPVSPVVFISDDMGGCYGQTIFQSLEFHMSYSSIGCLGLPSLYTPDSSPPST